MPSEPTSLLITGASSGLGAALAELYAAPGVRLALSGRDQGRLIAVSERCRAKGADVGPRIVDVTDRAAMARWIGEADTARPLDLVIANAGVSAGTGLGGESPDQVRHILAINVDGTFNTILPAIPAMVGRGRGQIALMASLGAFRGFPGAPTYCASKATIKVYGEALRGDLGSKGVRVNVICPGYVDTAMTRVNRFPMPLLMDAERAAHIIRRGLARDRPRIAFPFPLYVLAWLAGALPPALIDPVLARLPRKI
ncbi:MAG: SDR family NAD(P)-dependent oxidoreductase [Alphaproteobacteria bacterium]|nr:SDR family NAD(P)-dependent oxidoreductase [Alphaproteobacteria bacterium]